MLCGSLLDGCYDVVSKKKTVMVKTESRLGSVLPGCRIPIPCYTHLNRSSMRLLESETFI